LVDYAGPHAGRDTCLPTTLTAVILTGTFHITRGLTVVRFPTARTPCTTCRLDATTALDRLYHNAWVPLDITFFPARPVLGTATFGLPTPPYRHACYTYLRLLCYSPLTWFHIYRFETPPCTPRFQQRRSYFALDRHWTHAAHHPGTLRLALPFTVWLGSAYAFSPTPPLRFSQFSRCAADRYFISSMGGLPADGR